jgi:hypothetical protein
MSKPIESKSAIEANQVRDLAPVTNDEASFESVKGGTGLSPAQLAEASLSPSQQPQPTQGTSGGGLRRVVTRPR